jgi:uncharacterized protein
MEQEHMAYLELADWRRRVAGLYAEVRALAVTDPAQALTHWRTVREHLYRTHPQSPLPIRERAAFTAQHFPPDLALRFEVPVVLDTPAQVGHCGQGQEEGRALARPAPGAAMDAAHSAAIPTSTGGMMALRRIGWVDVPFPVGTRRLALFWMEDYAGGLYLPFRDATNGVDTYGAGRYLLDGAKSADLGGDPARGTLILDFNFAYHPSCAFDPRWACPLTPPENHLDLPIRVGERLP